jgi:hypothetical protein
VIIHDRVFIPTTVVRRFSVPVEYDTRAHVVKIRGPKHWTAFSVNPRPSPTVVRVVKAAHPGKALGHSKGMSHPAKASPAKGKPAAKSSNKGKGKGHNK